MDKKYTATGFEVINQCCVCRLPAFPAGTPEEAQSHGYHSQCYREFYKDDPEALEELEYWKVTIEGDEMS